MKNAVLFLLFSLFLATGLFAQKEVVVYLKNGSQLRGQLLDAGEENIVQLSLMADDTIELDKDMVEHIDHRPASYQVLNNGSRVLKKGKYSSFGFHTLTAEYPTDWQEGLRVNLGAHFSMGHQFSRALGLGAGIGLDLHEQVFVPVFLETSGLSRKPVFAGNTGSIEVPFSWSLQVGYNLPVEEWLFDPNEFEKLKGGWLVYPAIGLAFPSRKGHTFRFDFGYKFQRYTRTYDQDWWWWGSSEYEQVDRVTLKSLALRAGWFF